MKFCITPQRAITGAALLLLLLLLFLFAYSHPHSDDYSYDYFLRHKGYWNASLYIYQYSGGRFFATALIFLSPLVCKSVVGYQILTATLFLWFVLSLYFFCRVVSGRLHALLLTAFIFLVCCSFLPDLHEFSYWLCAEATYLAAAALFLSATALHILLAQEIYAFRSGLWVSLFLNTLLLCGCSEAGLLLGVVPVGIHIAYRWWVRQQDKRLYVLAAFLICISLIVAMAPGNLHRHAHTPFSGSVLLALSGGIYSAVSLLARWMLPLVISGLVYAFLLAPALDTRFKPVESACRLSAKQVLAAGLLFFTACQVAAVWMSGSVPEARFENVLFLFLLLVTLFAVQLRAGRTVAALQASGHPLIKGMQVFGVALLVAVYLSVPNNFSRAINDLASGSAHKYHLENQSRYAFLRSACDSIVAVAPITAHPHLLYYPTANCLPHPDEEDLPRMAMADYFGKKWIYEYPCSPEYPQPSWKDWLKQKRQEWFSDSKK